MNQYPIENRINASVIDCCKELEGCVILSGVNLSKKISSLVAIGLLTSQQKKVYQAISEKPKSISS